MTRMPVSIEATRKGSARAADFVEALAEWCASVDVRNAGTPPRRPSRWARMQDEQDAASRRRG